MRRTAYWTVELLMLVLSVAVATGARGDQLVLSPPVILPTDPDGIQRGDITLDSYSYTPDHVIVRAGRPVELTLTSKTWLTPHNFVMKESAADIMVDKDVSAGENVTVRFTPQKPGIYSFYCDKKLLFFKSHREKGMEGLLEVQ